MAGETRTFNLNTYRMLEAQLKYTICRQMAYEEVANCISLIMPEQDCVCACARMKKKKNLEH